MLPLSGVPAFFPPPFFLLLPFGTTGLPDFDAFSTASDPIFFTFFADEELRRSHTVRRTPAEPATFLYLPPVPKF